MFQLLWKTVWRFLKKFSMELADDPEILLLGIYPKELETGIQSKTGTQVFISALFIIATRWKQSKCPSTNEWVNKMWYIHEMK